MASLGVAADSATNRVRGVEAESLGARLGVAVGDVILEVNSNRVEPNQLASVLGDTDTIESVVVGRGGNRIRLSLSGEPTIEGAYGYTPSGEEPWASSGRVFLGRQIVAESKEVESSGSNTSGFGLVAIALSVILGFLVTVQVSAWLGIALLVQGCVLGGLLISAGKHISLQAKTARFLVKESLTDTNA